MLVSIKESPDYCPSKHQPSEQSCAVVHLSERCGANQLSQSHRRHYQSYPGLPEWRLHKKNMHGSKN